MQITKTTLPFLRLLQGFGLNKNVRGWNRALAYLFPHHVQRSRYLETSQWGVPYLANPANYIDWNVLCFGDYERDDLNEFKRLCRHSAICLDVGANIGHHTVFFASLGWTIHAFEPNPELWEEFELKVAHSGAKSVFLHKVGLGAEDAIIGFELENNANSGTGRFVTEDLNQREHSMTKKLPVRNGDRYLESIGIGRVDVIKIDVQGFEPEALTGLKGTIKRYRPLLCIEISPDNAAKFRSFDGFKSALPPGYTFFLNVSHNQLFIRRTSLRPYSGSNFTYMSGNVFCAPFYG